MQKTIRSFPNAISYFIDIMMGDNNYINFKAKVPLYAAHLKKLKAKTQILISI
ncbi:hypothetical protein ACETAC_05105 [Aceticella autotrophica]|uniref:Uncharacterized protein n=1 Tax=Aceticella autotrophica TaxID=2755338 RepID=A0A975GBE1_9THEO|nr:hypothetical protein [Aceticella autotrophica]QSZ28225.1 hypothetical protein ACETAC_05105 [Aceticella autotrophica]